MDDFRRDIEHYNALAGTEPVTVSQIGHSETVLISIEEYQRLKRRDRQVLSLNDFSDDDIAAIEGSHAPRESRSFDHELL
jgi:hypothetical protein